MRPEGDERPPGRRRIRTAWRPDERGAEPDEPEAEQPDEEDKPEQAEAPEPEYTVYGKGGEKRKQRAPERASEADAAKSCDKPDYKVYRSRPSLRDRLAQARHGGPARGARRQGRAGAALLGRRLRRRRRWLRWLLIGIGVWLLISFVAFAISAQIQKGKLPDSAKQALDGGPYVLAGQNILILGGDRRGEPTRTPAAARARGRRGPTRSWSCTPR